MHEIGMQEEVADKLEQVEVICHKEMKTPYVSQVYSTHFEHQRSQESDAVDNQQIFCYSWNTEHHVNLRFAYLLFTICAIMLFGVQNYEKYLILRSKKGGKQLFSKKNIIFSAFLLFF